MTSKDDWCWEQSFIDVNLGAEDLEGITFVQKGYWVNIISTHNVDGYLTQPDGSNVNLKIKVQCLTIIVHISYVMKLQLHKVHFLFFAERFPENMCGISRST